MPSPHFSRADRLAAELRRLLGTMVHEAVRDHVLPSVSVSDVEVTRDYEYATIYVTALLPDTASDAVQALNRMAKDFRRALGRQMHIRRVPELRFKYDESVDRGERIEALLRGTKTGDKAP